jgi:hypothetical protein
MPWSPEEIEALRGLYYQSSYYSQRFGGPNVGLNYDQIAARMSGRAARENWPARQNTGGSIANQLRVPPYFGPPRYLEPPYNGPSGPPGSNFPVNFNFR